MVVHGGGGGGGGRGAGDCGGGAGSPTAPRPSPTAGPDNLPLIAVPRSGMMIGLQVYMLYTSTDNMQAADEEKHT